MNENNNSTSQFDRVLTKQTPSVVEINNHECNFDLFTQQDTTVGETLMHQKLNLGDSSSELISRFEDLAVTEEECAYTANDKCATLGHEKIHQQLGEMVARNEGNVGKEQTSNLEISEKKKVHEASEESLRDFALKLGYSESTISAGLSKLGPSADKNSLLSELLKAQSSVKQLEEGSSTFFHEKPHPAPEDSSCLRAIVIDGSNVAMR